jgi:hypothetical protein
VSYKIVKGAMPYDSLNIDMDSKMEHLQKVKLRAKNMSETSRMFFVAKLKDCKVEEKSGSSEVYGNHNKYNRAKQIVRKAKIEDYIKNKERRNYINHGTPNDREKFKKKMIKERQERTKIKIVHHNEFSKFLAERPLVFSHRHKQGTLKFLNMCKMWVIDSSEIDEIMGKISTFATDNELNDDSQHLEVLDYITNKVVDDDFLTEVERLLKMGRTSIEMVAPDEGYVSTQFYYDALAEDDSSDEDEGLDYLRQKFNKKHF